MVADNAPDPKESAGPARSSSGRWARRAAVALAALALIGLAGAWAFTRLGWQRLTAQIAAEVVYEDEQARAGKAELALKVWAAPPADAPANDPLVGWRARRADEVALTLAAPLPAGHLTPVDEPPSVAVTTSAADSQTFVATVVRAYTDSSGQRSAFALPQRYRRLGPGLFERLPPDSDALTKLTDFTGQRLSASLPVDDLPWLSDSLTAVDTALVQACAAWGETCLPDWKLQVVFAGTLESLPAPAGPPGAAGQGAYPLAFDLTSGNAAVPVPLILPSPHLAGLPYNEAARHALTRSLTVHGLKYLANSLATGGRHLNLPLFFYDALVARAELRLGLSPAPTFTPSPLDYLPPAVLWAGGDGGAAALPYRLQVLGFLNEALAGKPPVADSVLLAGLPQQADPYDWLDAVLGAGQGLAAAQAWMAHAEAAFEAEGSLTWQQLDGLLYECDQPSSILIRGGKALPRHVVLPGGGMFDVFYGPHPIISPDGRWLASFEQTADETVLTLLDLDSNATQTVAHLPKMTFRYLVGWSSTGRLVYVYRDPTLQDTGDRWSGVHLASYDLATGVRQDLTSQPAVSGSVTGSPFLPDGSAVLVYLPSEVSGSEELDAPALVSLDPPNLVRQLAEHGYSALISPDGSHVAFAVPVIVGDELSGWYSVDVVEVASGRHRTLLTAEALAAAGGTAPQYKWLLPMAWSPDGHWLVVQAIGDTQGAKTRLLLVSATGEEPRLVALARSEGSGSLFMLPVGFSGNGHQLAYLDLPWPGTASTAALRLVDLDAVIRAGPPPEAPLDPSAGAAAPPVAMGAVSATWSPDGRLLAVAGPEGLRVIDPATGLVRWVRVGECGSVEWLKQ